MNWKRLLVTVGKWLLQQGGEEVAEAVTKKAKRKPAAK
jgi:hypothetical protein